MATRETFHSTPKCPKCGLEGEAKWEENATPPHHDGALDPVLISLSKGLVESKKKGKFGYSVIECKACKVECVS